MLNSGISSRPLLSARLRAVVKSGFLVDLMDGGLNIFQWSRPCIDAASMVPASLVFFNIMVEERWGLAIAAVIYIYIIFQKSYYKITCKFVMHNSNCPSESC